MMYKLVWSLIVVLLVIGAQPAAAFVAQENQGSKTSVEEGDDRDLPAEIVLRSPDAKRSVEIVNPTAVFEVMKAIENADQPDGTKGKGDKLGTLALDEQKWMAIYYSKDRSSVFLEWDEKTSVMGRKEFFALFQPEVKVEHLPPGEDGEVQPIPPGEGIHPDDIIPLP